jgi:hypothetical protein
VIWSLIFVFIMLMVGGQRIRATVFSWAGETMSSSTPLCYSMNWVSRLVSCKKIFELMHESVLLCLMLYIRFSKYNNAIGPLQKTFFNDSVRYMMCIMSKMTLVTQTGLHADFVYYLSSRVFVQHHFDHGSSCAL